MPSELEVVLARRRAQESGEIWATAIPFSSLDLNGVTVFLGSGRDASNLEKLRENGVRRILNVADDVLNYHEKEDGFKYSRLEVADFGGEALKGGDEGGIQRLFGKAVDFVAGKSAGIAENATDNACANDSRTTDQRPENVGRGGGSDPTISEGPNNVLVHCANGSNRSVTVTLALLMIIDGRDLQTSWNTVQGRRKNAMPLRDNRHALLEFERNWRGRNSMTEGFFRKSV